MAKSGSLPARFAPPVGWSALLVSAAVSGCSCESGEPATEATTTPSGSIATNSGVPADVESRGEQPALLFIPDAATEIGPEEYQPGFATPTARCPFDMVDIAGRFCIDRYEARLVDVEKGRRVSPYYHPTLGRTKAAYESWERMRFTMGGDEYQRLPVPVPPAFQLNSEFRVKAVSEPSVVPNGYLTGDLAEQACRNAGKRLCREAEWVMACRGEANRQYPYGDTYEQGRCNVKQAVHPAAILHGSASIGHLDPRLNHFAHGSRPLLHTTGSNPDCASKWGNDAVYDMVGNLDEWIDDPEGTFLGGFYSRNTKEGCLSKITAHPMAYYDYSLGVRCCK
jgi:formylglycine-generating enzyme